MGIAPGLAQFLHGNVKCCIVDNQPVLSCEHGSNLATELETNEMMIEILPDPTVIDHAMVVGGADQFVDLGVFDISELRAARFYVRLHANGLDANVSFKVVAYGTWPDDDDIFRYDDQARAEVLVSPTLSNASGTGKMYRSVDVAGAPPQLAEGYIRVFGKFTSAAAAGAVGSITVSILLVGQR